VSVGEIVLRNETTGIVLSKGCATKNLCKIQGDATKQLVNVTKLVRIFVERIALAPICGIADSPCCGARDVVTSQGRMSLPARMLRLHFT
jgi:hypothetical protein